ncbi:MULTISPECIES: SagB/ThcOx family dehydrogenase [Dehalococcoides]|jgi:SagB-type dehydrogenase family enzyme|uniref:Nitroreductase n=2 Tax=Dehalococcoides mccartyi TaxID=61435 RepID=A0A142VB31_9CHLR|nr:SagB/ThcOx family dehydrogenase [Dehalococcoides mccartyi]AGG07835.1 mcbC-like oxidoreductase [Dehalococcoides mccartyi BTF08]AII60914.1 nitroreductase [Dehalococcoides mccartyi CG5]AMU86537.1 nitroreductase [Dehalococcoides mccartyi]AOV99362.1 nitroreductase family protein [Dehalococcoides mccartyi]AQU05842.1 nitroreductase [Dehalococcoides mccartyi]
MTDIIKLPPPSVRGKMTVEEAISKRRSVRSFSNRQINRETLSQLLWASDGITDTVDKLRSAPSAGAIYPLDLYIIAGNKGVEGLEAGVYRYNPERNGLYLQVSGDFRKQLAEGCFKQDFVADAPFSLVICYRPEDLIKRYGNNAEKYAYFEVGHVAQNFSLACVALGLGSVVIGAFTEETICKSMNLNGHPKPLYIIAAGFPAA